MSSSSVKYTISGSTSTTNLLLGSDRRTSFTDRSSQITFSWKNLTVSTKVTQKSADGNDDENSSLNLKESAKKKGKPKTLLQNVSGLVKPGEIVAIMGASGAGKSTLLNALTFRNLAGLEVLGNRYANGIPVTPNYMTTISAYVQQDDMFIGTLSVREQLVFQARVRMDRRMTLSHRMEWVESVLLELGLSKCADTLIGIPGQVKGVSGGERKRLAVACEILTNPSLLFCDEPTSGLDAFMAQNVVQVLRTLAEQGKTILCTIHQPSSQVFALFDRVIFMSEGRVAYLGELEKAKRFFREIGIPCPRNFNPADHYVQVLALIPGEEDSCRKRADQICTAFNQSYDANEMQLEIQNQIDLSQGLELKDVPRSPHETGWPYRASWREQFSAVLWRSSLAVIKDTRLLKSRVVNVSLLAIVLGLVYFGQDYETVFGVTNINGAMFQMVNVLTFQFVFVAIQAFSMEIPIFLHEHWNGMYRTDVYFLSKQVLDLPIYSVIPGIFVTIFYWMVGLNPTAERFLVCLAIGILMTQVVISFGYFISCIAPSPNIAFDLAMPIMTAMMIFGGFFLNVNLIPSWFSWLQYLSWFRYGFELVMINQWRDIDLMLHNSTITTSCTYESGDDVLAFYGFKEDNFWFNIFMLILMMLVLRTAGYFALLSKTVRKDR